MPLGGLSSAAAAARLARDGPNELSPSRRGTTWPMVIRLVREPMFLLLMLAGLVYLMVGDAADAFLLLGFVAMTMSITIGQERKAERVLATLRQLSSPRVTVVRDRRRIRIAGRDVVKGDLLVLEEGGRVGADAVLVQAHDLLVDESLLTGESLAVSKRACRAQAMSEPRDGTEDAASVYAGTLVTRGAGLALVSATGASTMMGRIGRSLDAIAPEASPSQRQITLLVKRFAWLGGAVSCAAFLAYGLLRDDWLNALLAAIALAMSLLPEEFVVIMAVFLALGAWRLSRHRVLARHIPVIETLGSVSVLCVDKTGTLTQNSMRVTRVVLEDIELSIEEGTPVAPAVRDLLEVAMLASEARPFDPMEAAFHRTYARLPADVGAAGVVRALVHEYPLGPQLMAMTQVWRARGDPVCLVATKGAPEAIVRLCRLDPSRSTAILTHAHALGTRGLRVLAVAKANFAAAPWPDTPFGFDFAWCGLIGLADPIRQAVPQAVSDCHRAGIRIVMITGDLPATAQAIAREVGIPAAQVMTGAQLTALSDAQLRAAAGEVCVFARTLPEQKLRLVSAYKARGQIVAMTGDGVNDAPALKAAHVGIAMGGRGTDVAREAASLVLLDDAFDSIVRAVALGREIYDNLRKALTYVVAVHVPIACMAILPLLAGTPVMLAPIHIVFLEMIINPACALVFAAEAPEPDILRRAPRPMGASLFGRIDLLLAGLQGTGLFASATAVFLAGYRAGWPDERVRASVFVAIVLGNLACIIVNRSPSRHLIALLRIPNRAQWWVVAGTCGALVTMFSVAALRSAFHVAPLGIAGWIWPILSAVAVLAWCEALKLVRRRYRD